MSTYNLQRFHKAQESTYHNALLEIRGGKKTSHWMWFIFPQIAGLGYSETARFYAIHNLEEAELYLQDEILAERLITISKALLQLKGKTAHDVFGSPDDLKLKSSMTLFSSVKGADPVFHQVLDYYFGGKKDEKTLRLID
ncbi:DUF1810 domain-containing protein [Rubrolithibacter danxiaensis]|uniref:DUF1810 domain-containing protein n=1 Tax=Rubrolithibacter danxiaensis TaxID=3390805 RepID=UPI003BF84733